MNNLSLGPKPSISDTPQFRPNWQVLFSFGFIYVSFIGIIFKDFQPFGSWLTYIFFAFFILINLYSGSYFEEDEKRHNTTSITLFCHLGAYLLLIPIYLSLETRSEELGNVNLLLTCLFICVLVSAMGFWVSSGFVSLISVGFYNLFSFFSAGLITIFAISTTRIGSLIKPDLKENFLLYLSISTCIGLAIGLTQRNGFGQSKNKKRSLSESFVFTFFVFVIFLLASRTDQIFNIAGAKFHWSYFTGAIDTLRSGGTLLWDTPSQYGLGPILIPTLLPINNSTTAFLIFQATLMFVTVGFGLYVLRKITSNLRSFVILGLIWILVYFFADPALIGPQPYPSSSAVRFGPSLIFASFLLLALFSKLKETKPLIYKIGLPLIAAVSFCWSAESSIYSLAIFGAYLLGNILYADEKNLFENLVKPILFVAAGVFSVLAVICVVVYSRVGHMPDFGMFFMYSRGYAEGFGSYGLEFASPVWLLVLVVSLLSVSWVVGTKTERNRTFIRMTIVLVGATGAWFSYFVSRAVPDNVIAMLPLIVFPLLVVTAFASPLSTTSELTVAGEKVSKSTFLWWLSIIAVLLTVSTLVLTNPIVKILTPGWLPAFQSSVKPLPWTDEALAPPALVEALNSIPAEYADLPIAYEGYHGVLLKTEGVLEWTPNTSQVWIPTPLGLLEEPITSAKQEQILSRFMASSPRDGLFIWDIKNSFPDRAERWKQLIQATHTCQQVYLSEDYEILQCAVTK